MTHSAKTSQTTAGGSVVGTIPTALSAGSALRRTAARWQFWLLLPVLALLILITTQLISSEDTQRFGLQNTDLDGYAALASVLDDQGVQIHPTGSAQQLRELQQTSPDAPVVVMVGSWPPEESVVERLEAAQQVVWLTEHPQVLEEPLGLDETQPGASLGRTSDGKSRELTAGQECTVSEAQQAESIQASGFGIVADQGCFLVDDGTDEDESPSFALVPTDAGVVFGAPEAFTNQRITDAGNAALALNLMGGDTELIWYTPSGDDLVGPMDWGSPIDLMPNWLIPLLGWLSGCAVVALVVFGRRRGPVVIEPLPVQVPASETSEGRTRLYAKANAVTHSAAALRSGHMLRIARMLRLGRKPAPTAIAHAAAHQTGRDTHEVLALLASENIQTNAQLTHFAQELANLEQEIRESTRMQRRTGP